MKEKIWLFSGTTIVLLQLFVFFPLTIWMQNQFNISVHLLDGMVVFIYMMLIIVLISSVLALITPQWLRNYLLPLIAVFSLLIFIQQNVLVWDYGILDGNSLDFSHTKNKGWIDFSLWSVALLVFILKRKYLLKKTGLIITFSALVSSFLVLQSALSYDFDSSQSSLSYTEKNKFNFSKNENVMLFVLDGFQSGIFWQMITNEPELAKEFEGFTYYPNTTSVFSKTYPSIPMLLTGRIYQKKQPIASFLNSAYDDSLLTNMVDSGWDVGLYPYVKNTIKLSPSIMSNFFDKISMIEKSGEYLQVLDLTLFRSAPHFLKKKIFNKGHFMIHDDMLKYLKKLEIFAQDKGKSFRQPKPTRHVGLNFLENIKSNAQKTYDKPVFRFYHLMMPHAPFVLNKNLEYGNFPRSFESYKDYAYASIKLMIEYLKQLKKLDVYDNSTIIITADHGGGDYTENNYNPKTNMFAPKEKNSKPMASAKPLLLIKKLREREPLTISTKPVSLLDVAPTIAQLAKIELGNAEGKGYSIENVPEKDRLRTYYYYKFTGWDSKYLQDFKIYEINGDVYEDGSWEEAGTLTAKTALDKGTISNYSFNKTIRFGKDLKFDADFNNQFLVGENFYYSHSSVVARDQQFNLSIQLDEPLIDQEYYKIELNMSAYKNNIKTAIEIGNKHKAYVTLNKKTKVYEVYFQADQQPDPILLNLKIYASIKDPKAKIHLSKIIIHHLKALRLHKVNNKTIINFSDNIKAYHAKGFSNKRSWGRSTIKPTASLLFEAEGALCQSEFLKLSSRTMENNMDYVRPTVYINGEKLQSAPLTEGGESHQWLYDCSEIKFDDNKVVVLTLEMNDTTVETKSKKRNRAKAALMRLEFTQ